MGIRIFLFRSATFTRYSGACRFEKRYKRAARTAAAELSRAYLEAVSHALLARRRGMRFRNRQARYDEPPSESETESEYLFPLDTTIYKTKVMITEMSANKLKNYAGL